MTKIGLAISGSFCTFSNLLIAIDDLVEKGFDITPIFSFNVANLDTRFFKAKDFRDIVEQKTGKTIIDTIVDAEPIGTKLGLDLLLIAPCTGNTLAKIAHGITDTPVTMAAKAQLRNSRPIVLSVSSNDALGANAKNLGTLMNSKNIFFVPFGQDSPTKKSNSLIANTELICKTCEEALKGNQIQPVLF
ncbi:MAG: dipicolinate synthase subunit B [Clostridia bacterium]|nr:dipicolinate synthase subunit B [Clostridia bacterium]